MRYAHNSKDLVEIDNFYKLSIRDLMPLFNRCLEYLKDNSTAAKMTDESYMEWHNISIGGFRFNVRFYPYALKVMFEWDRPDGQHATQDVGLIAKTHKDWKGSYYLMFRGPVSGLPCLKLYSNCYGWFGRRCIAHTYSSRNTTHKQRREHKYMLQWVEEVRKGFWDKRRSEQKRILKRIYGSNVEV